MPWAKGERPSGPWCRRGWPMQLWLSVAGSGAALDARASGDSCRTPDALATRDSGATSDSGATPDGRSTRSEYRTLIAAIAQHLGRRGAPQYEGPEGRPPLAHGIAVGIRCHTPDCPPHRRGYSMPHPRTIPDHRAHFRIPPATLESRPTTPHTLYRATTIRISRTTLPCSRRHV